MAAKEIKQVNEHLALLAKFRVRDRDGAIAPKIAMRGQKDDEKLRQQIRAANRGAVA